MIKHLDFRKISELLLLWVLGTVALGLLKDWLNGPVEFVLGGCLIMLWLEVLRRVWRRK